MLLFWFILLQFLCVSVPFKNFLRSPRSLIHTFYDSRLSFCEQTVLNTLENVKIPRSSILLLSVSGGVDSVAMLHIFQRIRMLDNWKNLQLKIIHFNHKMRIQSDEEVAYRFYN